MSFDFVPITVIVLSIIYYTIAADICADEPDGALLANPDDCSKFFHCDNGIGYLGQCPTNLYFNPETETCDRQENVNCEVQETEEGIHCPPDDDPNYLIYYPSKIRCEWYYLCANGIPHKLECAPGYHWHQENFQCDRPEIAGCKIVQSTTEPPISLSTATISTHTSTTTSRTSSTLKTSSTSAQSTTESTSHSTMSTTFAPHTSTTTADITTTTDANGVSCPSFGLYTLPHPTRCEMFIFCRDGYSTLQRCPGFYNFDSIEHVCLFRNYAKCLPSSSY